MARPYKCPFCGATDSVSEGVRKTKTIGIRRIRLCKACGRKFTPKNQRPNELLNQEAEEQAETNVVLQRDAEVPCEPEAPGEDEPSAEPAHALSTEFPPPDEQWTS